jgi:hypothetical protein
MSNTRVRRQRAELNDVFVLDKASVSKMAEFKFQKYALMCMRLAAECRGLAADVPEPDLRAHFLHMAGMWMELADQPRVLHQRMTYQQRPAR